MSLVIILQGSAFFAGIAMGVASILSFGPNNLNLIREGLMDGRVGLVATIIWVSRLLMLSSAFMLTDFIASNEKIVRPIFSWLGLLTLCWFAFSSVRVCFQTSRPFYIQKLEREAASQCVCRILAVFWLNPLTYVEMLFVPAAISASFVMPFCRALFIAGLVAMATTSCYGYAFGGKACAPLFRQPNALRMFDLASGIILTMLAIAMAVGLCLRPN